MKRNDKLVQLIKEQIEIEKENVRQVGETEKKVGNAAAELFLNVIKLDSKKHVDIFNGLLKVLRGIPPSKTLWEHRMESYIDPFVVKRELENHMEREDAMIVHVEEEIKQTEDEGLELLLQHIADDERKHHKILQTVVKHLHKVNP